MSLTIPHDSRHKIYHHHTVDDTLTPLGFRLRRRSTTGEWEAVNLTGMTVEFRMVDEDGTAVVSDEEIGITITDATNGEGHYDFDDSDVGEAGVYYAWIRVVDPVTLEVDTYPAGGRRWVIVLHEAA